LKVITRYKVIPAQEVPHPLELDALVGRGARDRCTCGRGHPKLASGVWYSGVAAYTSAGTEGALSPIVSKSIA
jgi:hypothetical protein